MRRIAIIAVLLVVVIVAAGVILILQSRGRSTTAQPVPLSDSVTRATGKPKPISDYFKGCPPSGDGGDPVLNTLKNRMDESVWQPTTVADIMSLDWPKAIEGRPRSRWSAEDKADIAEHEGSPVQLEGYFVSAKRMSPESCNCHSKEDRDFHIWMVDNPNAGRDVSVVLETTPRVMAFHPEWTIRRIGDIGRERQKVRVSGWLMMDPEHPDQIGKTRGTIWEIHPVMQIEVLLLGRWVPLDNGSTGITSESSGAPATLAPVTPESTATTPPVSDTRRQDNQTVRITNIFFDGVKGSSEPDEYVEITNTGQEPVDITDWELQDTTGTEEFKWESFTLQPGQKIRVYTNETNPETGGFSFGSTRALWRNSGDVAELYDSDAQLVSRYTYGEQR
jgi:hypothetical protein